MRVGVRWVQIVLEQVAFWLVGGFLRVLARREYSLGFVAGLESLLVEQAFYLTGCDFFLNQFDREVNRDPVGVHRLEPLVVEDETESGNGSRSAKRDKKAALVVEVQITTETRCSRVRDANHDVPTSN